MLNLSRVIKPWKEAPYAETNSRRLFAAFAVDTLTEETGFAGLGEVSLTRASRFSLPAN